MLQMESTECGAASLGMVLGHHGRFERLDELRVACGVSRDGATAKNVVAAARSFGLSTRALKREPESLKELSFPLIVHWKFYHFLVVEGWYPGGWYLNDPASGTVKCPDHEFDKNFTGIALELKPGEQFEKTGSRPGVLGRLFAASGTVIPAIAAAIVIGVLLLIPTILMPQVLTLYGNQLNGLLGITAVATLIGLAIALGIASTLQALQGALSIRLSTKISLRLTATMVQRLLQLPAAFHAQRGAAVTTQRALLIDGMSAGVSALTLTLGTAVLTSLAALIVLFLINVSIGLTALLIAVLTVVLLKGTLSKAKDEAAKVVVETVEAGAVMASALSQIESIKAAGSEDGMIAAGVAATNRQLEAEQKVAMRMLVISAVPTFLIALANILITGLAVFEITQGRLAPGALIAVIALTAMLVGPLGQIVMMLAQVQILRPALDQVDDVLDADLEVRPTPTKLVPSEVIGDVVVRGATFGYSTLAPPVIKDLDLHLPAGGRVALVGPSGCGKSTISKLVSDLYQPWSGEVLIDGRPRWEHSQAVLTDAIALVDQNLTIFAGTIRDNVTLWDPEVSDESVMEALHDAQLANDVLARPGGLEAVLSEGGSDLSGGQRQRLEIARALARNPRILILDEATSALDPPTETLIDQAIRRRGISVLVIAHRLSTIRDSDEIVVLELGEAVERGTHVELMELKGAYFNLVSSG